MPTKMVYAIYRKVVIHLKDVPNQLGTILTH